MAQLWGGRFTKETDQLVYNFNASITFDKRFYKQDIKGSLAHVAMLAKQGILTEEEKEQITDGLNGILEDVESGKLEISDKYEDIHSFVEATLIDRIGDPGKKLHTGRSRNDQVALDMKLFTRDEIHEIDAQVKELLEVILHVMEENVETYMPGFTHLQKAQPITLAHHMGAYFEMFRRDHERLQDIAKRMNTCPLGSGALAGTTYPLDREYTAELLGFDGPTLNSMDGVSDRDYLLELLSALSIIMMHLSRFCEEVIIWNSNEYQFVEIDDAYSTGSSIMPQKKNPDIAELVRGKTGRVYGALNALLTTMKRDPACIQQRYAGRQRMGIRCHGYRKRMHHIICRHVKDHAVQQRPHGRKCKTRIHQRNRCSRLSGKSRCTIQRCTRHRRKTCADLYREEDPVRCTSAGRVQEDLTGI